MVTTVRATILISALMAPVFFTACASTPQQEREARRGQHSARQFRAELKQMSPHIDRTVSSLNAVVAGGDFDRQAALRTFSRDVSRLNQHAILVREQADSLLRNADAYFAHWEDEYRVAPSGEDPARITTLDRYRTFSTTLESGRHYFRRFASDLQEIERTLSADLSEASVTAARSMLGQANLDSVNLKQTIAVLQAELDKYFKE